MFLTDSDVCQPKVFERVELVIGEIKEKVLQAKGELKLEEIDVVLEADDTLGSEWEYYLIDHSTRHLFWLHKFTISTSVYKGAESNAHVGEYMISLRVDVIRAKPASKVISFGSSTTIT